MNALVCQVLVVSMLHQVIRKHREVDMDVVDVVDIVDVVDMVDAAAVVQIVLTWV